MSKKMLIDASHAEETRVVVLDGNRLEDFDVETAGRKQIKGNIYLAKVIRVEPSLQAAFVEYGGNRHGFLAFGEIHPDYYQIPVADRQRLIALQAEIAAENDDDGDFEPERGPSRQEGRQDGRQERHGRNGRHGNGHNEPAEGSAQALEITPIEIQAAPPPEDETALPAGALHDETGEIAPDPEAPADDREAEDMPAEISAERGEGVEVVTSSSEIETIESEAGDEAAPEQLGGDGDDQAEARERRLRQRFLRNYKIQDVIHRRQIMLVQVVKEERGNKGAALTTYLSLAGRFSVLMPNSPTGGGISRKITSQTDRRRLKEAMSDLDIPQGMGLIVRTAGANRPKPEITRDCEYLLRLWDDIRDKTLDSSAPALIYEEANLIKRSIRDVYTKDIEEILVDGEEGYKAARDFMRMLMPANARKVQLWGDGQPLFAKHQVEAQLDAMLSPVVQLRSGGYIVINQTEALVAIDVNSGRSTRERSIEDTALRTNLEAAEEAAKQLRMRDLAGLIVIDFIDMESRKNNVAVERRLKDSLKHDRARIQVGSISHFGLMEMSRQRLRPSLTEASLVTCPHCAGMGWVRSPESAALHVLRAIEDEGAKYRAAEICVALPPEIAFYLFNHKRERLSVIEERYGMRVLFEADAKLTGTNFRIDRLKAQTAPPPAPVPVRPERVLEATPVEIDEPEAEDEAETPETSEAGSAERGERKRRRRRRGKRRNGEGQPQGEGQAAQGEGEASDGEPVYDLEAPSELDLVLESVFGAEPEAETVPVVTPAPTPAPETALAPVAETAPEPEAKPKRVRKPRRKAGEEAAPEAVAALVEDVPPVAEDAPAAPKRRSRSRKAAAPVAEELPAEVPPAIEPEITAVAAQEAALSEAPAEEQAAEPVVKPILVGAGDVPAAKKTGWWRR